MTIEKFTVDPINNPGDWHALRAKDVTASTAGALFGLHPYQTAFGLWALKSGLIGDDVEESPPMVRGRLLEPVAVELLREMQPAWNVTRATHYYRDPEARLGATPDAYAFRPSPRLNARGVVQIKSVEPMAFRRKWRDEDGALSVPLWIAVQAAIEAYLTGAEWAVVAALVVSHGIDLHVVDIPLTPGLIDRVKHEVAEFWSRVEHKSPPPVDYAADGATIARLYEHETTEEPIDLTGDNRIFEVLANRAMAKQTISTLEQQVEVADAEIKAKLAQHATALVPGWRVTWKSHERKEYTVRAKRVRQLRITRLED